MNKPVKSYIYKGNIFNFIVMKNGNIVEFGTYKELIDNNAIFKSLVELN